MSEFEQTFRLEGSQYNEGITLNKRGDNYQLILVKYPKTSEGTVFWQMCYPQMIDGTAKKPRDKAVPWCINVGTRIQFHDLWLELGKAMGFKETIETNSGDKDIPF